MSRSVRDVPPPSRFIKMCRNTQKTMESISDDESVVVSAKVSKAFTADDCVKITELGGDVQFVQYLPDFLLLDIKIKVGKLRALCDIDFVLGMTSAPPTFPHQYDLGGEG